MVNEQESTSVVANASAVDAVKGDKKTEAYPVAADAKSASDYDIEKDDKGYHKIFSEFDKDGSGSVDAAEFRAMIEALGMAISRAEVDQMIKDADEDGNGTVEFGEFVRAMGKAEGRRAQAGAPSLASLVTRYDKCVSMSWREDKLGSKIAIDHETNSASRAGEGWAVAVLKPWMPDDEKRNRGSVILEVAAPSGLVWIGMVGKNFEPPKDEAEAATWFEQEFTDIKSERRSHVTACRSSDGVIYRNGAELPFMRARPFGTKDAPRVQIDFNGDDRAMEFRVLDADNEELAEVAIEQVKHEAAIAVCFGPTPAGAAPSAVRLVGSSIEKVEKRSRRASKDLWDVDNVVSPLGSA